MQEEIIIPLIVFGFIAIIVKMSLDYAKWKRMHGADKSISSGEGSSLGASELRMLIHNAVIEANEPLQIQLNKLEEQVQKNLHALPESQSAAKED